MVLYNVLPKKEYGRIFMCKTVKDIWQSLLIAHQGNSQVKDNKIDLLVQQYEQFTILEEESIDSGFARFNTIITSIKALDEGFSSKNYVRKFLRALHPKWRAKDSEIYKGKNERAKSIALKAKKESGDDETLTFKSDDEEYAMAKGKSDRKYFRCGDPNHLIGDYPKPTGNKDQKAFIGGSWIDSENDAEDKTNDETCLMAQLSNEVCLRTCLEPDEWIKDSGYSKHMTGKTEIVLNKHTMKVEESLNVTFDESPPPTKLSPLVDDDVCEEEAIKKNTRVVNNNNNEEDESIEVDEVVDIKESKNHPLDQVIGNLNQRTLRLKAFLIKHEYSMGMVDNTLFTKKSNSHLIIVKIYVDDIIFGSTSQNLCDDFEKIMHDEFEMSMMGELNFFVGLQIKQIEDRIFFNQSKYIKEMLKKFGLEDSKPTKTPMSTEIKLTKDDKANFVDNSKYRGTKIETVIYADSDHAGDYVDRKSTSRVCTFIGCCLKSWFAKKQTALSISTTEAEYISTGKACQQALWMKQALIDYDIRLIDVPIMCENKGAIDLKKPVQHSRTKHIEICHHFLRDHVEKGNISIEKVASEDNIADIFTKPLKCEVFNYLRLGLGMMELIMDSDSPSSKK
nr:copia protein [Tanacetum cinerariifolium]